jgi:hypothetical protein
MHNPAGVALRGREGDEACWATQPKPAPAAKRHPAEDRRSLHVPAPRVSLPRPGWRLLVKDAESLRPRCGTSCHPADPVASTKVVCDGPGDQRAENVKAATA